MKECVELRKLRKYNERTCEYMAKLLNISTRAYINKEKGVTQFKLNEMVIISRDFKKPMEEIFLDN